jgi:hypothetical protein
MGVRSGGSSYELLIKDYGDNEDALRNFLRDKKPCGWDGKHFSGYTSWDIRGYDYNSDEECGYSPEQITKDFPGCVLFGWYECSNDFECYPNYWNVIIVNGKCYDVSGTLVDGWGIGPVFYKDSDLTIDFYATYKKEDELDGGGE